MAWTAPKTWSVGETLTAANFNTHVRDNLLAVGPHLIVRKTSDQSVTSSTALVDCTSMVLTVGANEVWLTEWFIRYAAGATGDIKFGWTFPTGGEIDAGVAARNTTAATVNQFWYATTSPTTAEAFGTVNAVELLRVHAICVNGGTAGNYQLQFAQQVSDGTAATVKAHSCVWGVKLA